MAGRKYDLAQRVQALTLLGIGMKIEDVGWITGFSRSVLYNLKKQAIKRGYDFTVIPMIYNVYIQDAHKSGRLSINLEKQLEIVAKVTTDQHRREKSIAGIVEEVEVL